MGECVYIVGGGEVGDESLETFRIRRELKDYSASFFLFLFFLLSIQFISNMETEPQRRK